MPDNLQVEIDYLLSHGCEQMSVKAYGARFAALGYTLDRTLDCRSISRYLETGRTYPCRTTGLKETDTGMSAFHYQARRDDNFRAMQKIRREIFAVSRGAILEV